MGIIELDDVSHEIAKIKVIGVGGAGGNALNCMVDAGLQGVEFIAINTDAQALEESKARIKFAIGSLGAGGNPEKGREAMEERREELKSLLTGADMVFITAGMGGGTGTGAAPIVAELCKELGILTVAVVTKPFSWEQAVRKRNAAQGLTNLTGEVDTLITVNNQKILSIAEKSTTFQQAMKLADTVLSNAVRGVTDIIFKHGYVNVDFADIHSVMSHGGDALMGLGEAEGDQRALTAVQRALESPLLDDMDVRGASALLINICANNSLSMFEVNDAMTYIKEQVGEDFETSITFGAVIDEAMGSRLSVTVIATGFDMVSSAELPVAEVTQQVEIASRVPAMATASVSASASAVSSQEGAFQPVLFAEEVESPFSTVTERPVHRVEQMRPETTTSVAQVAEKRSPFATGERSTISSSFSGFQPPPKFEEMTDTPAFLRMPKNS